MKKICLALAPLYFCVLSSAFAQPSPPEAKQAASSNPEAKTDDTFSLESSMTLRDPFRRPIPKLADGADEGGRVPELQRYELDKFSLIGIITGLKKNKALVTTPDGRMHIVSENAVMGTRSGAVKRISAGFISVEEKVVNILGQEEKIETIIKLKEKEKEKGSL
ncbi:MAG: pilus assembly protein PilP [Bdellovibrionota bacterium]